MFSVFVLLFITIAGCSNNTNDPKNLDSFAQCLTEKGAKMYGTEWCSHCQNQKKAFGESFQYIDFVDCDDERNTCLSAGVRGYPTWIINGELMPGKQEFHKLAAATKCSIEVQR